VSITVFIWSDELLVVCIRTVAVLEIVVHIIGVLVIINQIGGTTGHLGVLVSSLTIGPVGAHVLDLGLVVEFGVVVFADATDTFPEGQVMWVDGNTVVVVLTTGTDVSPAAFLLLEVETGGVGHEDEGEEHAEETEPWDEVELGLRVDVVVDDGSKESTHLTPGGGETVGSGTDGSWEAFGGDQEGHAVGAELLEERGQEVHGLESLDTGDAGVELVVESRNNEEDEVHEETKLLHVLTANNLVVDEESGKVVTRKGAGNVN